MSVKYALRINIPQYDKLIKNKVWEHDESLDAPGNSDPLIIPVEGKKIIAYLGVTSGEGKIQYTVNKLEDVISDTDVEWSDWSAGSVVANTTVILDPYTAIRMVNTSGTTRLLARIVGEGPEFAVNSIQEALDDLDTLKKHIHNRERWFGKKAVQTATDWADEGSLTPFRAISGNGDYGSDANDEAQILGTEDTPIISGQAYFDLHRLLITGVSSDNPYNLRIVYGTGTMADAITAGQYATVMVKFDSANPTVSAGTPLDLIFSKIANRNKVWVQSKNETDNATIDFFVGTHGY